MAKGSIEKRGNNSWRLSVDVGLLPNGERDRKRKTITVDDPALLKTTKKLKDHLETELAKFKIEVEAGEYISPEKMKFEEFKNEWARKYAVKHLEGTTLENYNHHLKNHIIPTFGHMRIDQIKPLHVVTFLDKLSEPGARKDGKEGGLSGTSRRFTHRVLKDILDRAVEWKIIKNNPVSEVRRPKLDTEEKDFMDEDELFTMFELLETVPLKWRVMIELAATTGMRRGELLALDINKHIFIEKENGLESAYIQVRESLAYANKQTIFKDVKTKKSRRTIPVADEIMPILKKRIIEVKSNKLFFGDKWQGGDRLLLFGQDNGLPMFHTSPTWWFRKFLKKNKLKPLPFHGLRHTAATYLMSKGVPIKQIQSLLGHADIRTTGNMYTHAIEKMNKEAIQTFNQLKRRNS
ncbi:site-specific integrase [Paenibacillus kribbensis]|uniref:tyrosine-type recombinase/integrase n=1 Tax=Paenibacillus kribbensis TaxID=172713 RepID=UPI002DB8714D|nr:site-specific integrase [Paenibacillus kribbensis]MEC0233683.1 site-specific integrase [Paenibacillus kribbensis]